MLHDLIRPSLTWLACAFLVACGSTPSGTASMASPTAPATSVPGSVPDQSASCPAESAALASSASPADSQACIDSIDSLDQALAYAERVRPMNPAELQAELKALGDPGHQPARQMQVALVLMQMQQPVETARALGLLQRLQASATSEAETLRPLARLLAGMLSSQRRLEEQLERHAAQLRDAQRRIDRLSDQLAAMRAIERSLGPRSNGAPASRPATP